MNAAFLTAASGNVQTSPGWEADLKKFAEKFLF